MKAAQSRKPNKIHGASGNITLERYGFLRVDSGPWFASSSIVSRCISVAMIMSEK